MLNMYLISKTKTAKVNAGNVIMFVRVKRPV